MRFKIEDKVYESVGIDEISLADMMTFNRDAEPLGFSWADVERIASDEAEPQGNEKFIIMAVTIWLARRNAGEALSFADATEVKMTDIDILPEPGDHKPGKPKGAKKPRKSTPPSAQEGSAAVVELATTPVPQASEKPSSTASAS